jgi:tetratricopeptide (TPR) repeat protein
MVKAWREIVTIPTYEVGKPEKNPMFLEKRVYQGSSGVVYPYPVIESISNEKTDKEWQAIYLENEYIKVMVLPELGGRIQMAYDKIKQRHFVYYNHVIKPALVGLMGPWISGGIEFNWPQHHRPSTYMPVDSTIVENEDGSVTVWVNEMERMFHQKGMAGFTLRPGCAYLEIQGRVSNRTPLPQTFLWWANPAVEVNDDYQSVFPPDVNAVFDHGKRAVSSFPIATGTYYKMDYSAGVDISNYKNIYVPTSYMAVNSKYDFEGGYENDTHGGMLHVASHHFSPGKKQWTWGNGDFGRAWDRNLTDSVDNGQLTVNCQPLANNCQPSTVNCQLNTGFRPYIELMAGVYTENQPDFTWLMPYEEKQFVQYFMPYREIGIVKQASKDFIMSLSPASPEASLQQTEEAFQGKGSRVSIKVLATSKQEVRIVLRNKQGEEYYNNVVTLTPENVLEETVDVKESKLEDLLFTICKSNQTPLSKGGAGSGLLTWQAEEDEIRPIPDAAEAALPPQETKTNDQLYLTGLHLEQYRHATWSALDYYEEALRRDPNDVRCLNQTGLWYLRRGRFQKAEPYLRKAVKIWQKRNPNPYDGEAIFNLALCLKYQKCLSEAYELFWKSTWNKAWADAGYFEAACISVSEARYDDALDELNRCLVFNSCNHKARALKATVLRKLNEGKQKGCLQMGSSKELNERLALIKESLILDRFNYGIRYEQYLLTKDKDLLKELKQLLRKSSQNYDELALDYVQTGLYDEAIDIWTIAEGEKAVSPLTYYYIGNVKEAKGLTDEAKVCYEKAEATKSDYCFPNRLEDVLALESAKALNPQGAKAPYYLGCLYYDKRQYDVAIENWELSADLDSKFPIVWRNLALARFNKLGLHEDALTCMENAFHLNEKDSRMLMELDQLYKRLHKSHQERLAFLQKYPKLIQQRDDLVLEEITLLNQLGRYEEAMQKLDAHQFHPWEGGEGKVSAQYQICRVELAKKYLENLNNLDNLEILDNPIRLLQECLEYPPHLGEGKLYGAQENDFYYLLGVAYDALGQKEKAMECWENATKGPQEPAAAMYYNDAKPEKIFYQGLALRKLGRNDEANGRFYRLINYGKQHIFEKQTMDYFAVSLPDLLIWDDSLDTKNLIHCKFMLALGYYGIGDMKHAMRYLEEAEGLDNNHQGLQQFRTLISNVKQ